MFTGRLVLKKTVDKVDMVCFFACGMWCLADILSVSPLSEQTGELWGNQCLNSW